MFRFALVSAFLTFALAPSVGRADRMSPELLWKLGRLQSAALSADGSQVAYAVRSYDLSKNEGTTSIHRVALTGGKSDPLVEGLARASDLEWATTGGVEYLFILAARKPSDKSQVWRLDPRTRDIRRVTDVEDGVGHFRISPTGTHLAFTSRVQLDPDVADLYPDLPQADAQIIDSLLFRHWNRWEDGTYSHLHLARLSREGRAVDSVDLMKGLRFNCPVPPFAGREHFAWSPDGKEIALTLKLVKRPAESTDTDVYLIDVTKETRLRCITAGLEGYDMDPVYSPDGLLIAFHSMRRPGFEADRNRIMIYDRGLSEVSEVTEGLDQTAHSTRWAPDGRSLLFVSEWRGTNQIFRIDRKSGDLTQVSSGRWNWSLHDVSPDGSTLLVSRQSMIRPRELAALPASGVAAPLALTNINGEIYRRLELPTVKERWVRSTDGKKVHNWVIYPPDFDPEKRWPMLTYCQGGPQGQIGQWFSYRWNFHLMAAKGFVVLAVNRRGLPGFGRDWNDQISGDWGGQGMRDILAATDSMMTESYIDQRRLAAIGASFGGYTVYWLMGHHEGRFAAMISHCGVFNLESMYGSTEELFFVNWDLGGPYWESRALQDAYDRFSPHRFVKNWKTPLLVIHGEKDFRVPVTQGIEAFTAAQVQGVPSRFLYFPGEGHWVLGAQNGVLWHRVFFDWLDRWCGQETEGPRPPEE